MTVAQSLKTKNTAERSSLAMCWSRLSTPTIATQCDQILTGYFRASVGVVGMVPRRVPSLIKSIVLVISFLTLGAGVGAPGNSLHAEECLCAGFSITAGDSLAVSIRLANSTQVLVLGSARPIASTGGCGDASDAGSVRASTLG